MAKKQSADPARTRARVGNRKQNIPPLQWWRGEDKPSYDTVALRKALRGLSVLAYPDAHAAIAGDETIAVRIGLHVYAETDAPNAARLWWQASRTPIPELTQSISDVPELHLMNTQVAFNTSSQINVRAAIWTGASAILSALASVLGVL